MRVRNLLENLWVNCGRNVNEGFRSRMVDFIRLVMPGTVLGGARFYLNSSYSHGK